MNLETLAQDLTDKRQTVLLQEIALSEASMALFDAENALSDALCSANGSNLDAVAIALKNHVVMCEWAVGDWGYTMSFVSKAPNANT